MKQWGEWAPPSQTGIDIVGPRGSDLAQFDVPIRFGKKAAGRLLDGVQHDGYPS